MRWKKIGDKIPKTGNGDWLPNEAKRGDAVIIKLEDGRIIYEAYHKHGSWCVQKWNGSYTVTTVFNKMKATHWMRLPPEPAP